MLNYTIIRKPNRRTAAISVAPDNVVTVIIPKHITDKQVQKMVVKKERWIRSKLNQHLPKPKEYVSGETFQYLGRNYRLKVLQEAMPGAKCKDGRFYVSAKADIAQQLKDWYIAKANIKIAERVVRYSDHIGVEITSVKIKSLKRFWGSCSPLGNISFNWKIIMAPIKIVDYVVVHELCHLLIPNHSKEFWRQLGLIIEDYEERKKWLCENGIKLQL